MIDKLINFQQLSLVLTGKKENVRKNKVPKKHRAAVKELRDYLEFWKGKYGRDDQT